MEISNCPFCKGNHVKVMVNSTTDNSGWLNGFSVSGRTYRYSVRCNQCKARGPIASCWVPLSAEINSMAPSAPIVVAAYKQEKVLAEERAIKLWNNWTKK